MGTYWRQTWRRMVAAWGCWTQWRAKRGGSSSMGIAESWSEDEAISIVVAAQAPTEDVVLGTGPTARERRNMHKIDSRKCDSTRHRHLEATVASYSVNCWRWSAFLNPHARRRRKDAGLSQCTGSREAIFGAGRKGEKAMMRKARGEARSPAMGRGKEGEAKPDGDDFVGRQRRCE